MGCVVYVCVCGNGIERATSPQPVHGTSFAPWSSFLLFMEWSLDASCSVLLQYVHSHCVCLKWTVSNSWKKSFRCMCYCWSIKISRMHPDGKSLLWEQRICFALMFGSSLFLTCRSFFYAPPVLPCVTKRLTTNKSSWWKFIEMQGIRDCFLESQTLQTWCDNQLGESVGWAQAWGMGTDAQRTFPASILQIFSTVAI
jgi:hypothetical protein